MSKLTPAGRVFSELVVEVFRINGLALAAGDELAAPSGLTSSRWQVLGVVDHGPATVAGIARTMGLTRQSVLQTTGALQKEGFAEMRDNPEHRRARLVAITAAGRRALRQVELRHARWANHVAVRLRASNLAGAHAALVAMRRTLEEGT